MSGRVIILLFFIFTIYLYSNNNYKMKVFNDIIKNNGNFTTYLIKKALKEHTDPQGLTVEVRFNKLLSKSLAGELIESRIELNNALFNKLRVKNAWFVLKKPIIDMQRLWCKGVLKLKSVDDIKFQIFITEKELNHFLNAKEDNINIRRPEVKIGNDYIILRGYGEVFKIKMTFRVKGYFEVRDKYFIYFIPKNVKFNRIPLPGFMVKNLVKRINPVMDLREFQFPIRLDNIIMKDGLLILENIK